MKIMKTPQEYASSEEAMADYAKEIASWSLEEQIGLMARLFVLISLNDDRIADARERISMIEKRLGIKAVYRKKQSH